MRDRIRFYLNGQPTEAGGDEVFLTLAEFLRRRRGLTGTKVVCAEGDCGSCAVLIGRPDGDAIRYSAVTSCIQILFQLDATHVVTVEGLRDGQKLNPIQQAMVTCQGTQCGFCTPGFIVALQGLMDEGDEIDAEKVRRGLTGNLCRCTGYDSIIRAALASDRSALKSVDEIYPPREIVNHLKAFAGEEVRIDTPTRRFYKPISVEQATQFRRDNPACSVIAGATDLGVVYNKKLREINVALSLGGIASLGQVRIEPGAMHLGAGVTLATLELLARKHLPELARFMQWFGSPLIRNAGTIGGNLVTGSPIGDTIPALIVLGAEIEIAGVSGTRRVPIGEFYIGYRKTVLAADELVSAIRIPLLNETQMLKLYKISRRKDLDISSFGAAIWMQRSNGIVDDIRLAFGGVGPMVMRLPKAEAILRGQAPTLERFERAGEIAREEVTPISDVRGSAEYRRTLAGNILAKFWHEVIDDAMVPSPGLPEES
jgi:xanthine dehydrogenase small subunit